jgi:hypothetical protein
MLKDIILNAQAGNDDSILIMVDKFNPLLKKYSYKLSYDDDLLADFLDLIKNIDMSRLRHNCEGGIVSYICKSIYSSYINKSKTNCKYFQSTIPFSGLNENEKYYAELSLSTVDRDDALLVSSLNEILNQHEFCIIYTIYFLGYSSADIAQSSGTSRQAVNQTKRRALEKLRKAFVV